jgi:D-amino peptidase
MEERVKVYISVDMEGMAGAVVGDHMGGTGDYMRFRKIMTAESNAAVQGAFDGGATQVVVNDSHGPMTNILIEELHEEAELVSGLNKPMLQLEGIEDGFDALFFVGYHQREGGGEGVMNHTILGRVVYEIRVNGEPVDEAALNAAAAGAYGVPVALVTGDDAVCADAEARFPGVVTAPVKHAIDRYATRSMTPKKAQQLISARGAEAMEAVRSGRVQPYTAKVPVAIELDFKVTAAAHMASLIPGVDRRGPRGVTISGDDYITAYRTLIVAILYGFQLSEGKLF